MFSRCDFIVGKNKAVLIFVPERLPVADVYSVTVDENKIAFLADYEELVELPHPGGEVYESIANNTQVGIVEYTPGEDIPPYITNMAYVEVRRSV